MKIKDSKPGSPVQKYAPVRSQRTDQAAQAPVRKISDTASIMGIPADELTSKVRDAIMQLMAEVENLRQDLDQSRARIEYLERLADQDTLAPVANRRAFVRELSRVMSFSERYSSPSSVIYLDVNGLKEVNDTYGHAAGDAVLMRVADILIENVRESDVVGRLGGDEFAVILFQGDQNAAAEKAATLVERIESRPLDWNGQTIPIRLAHGIYTFQGDDDPGTALAAADKAMYVQKNADKEGPSSGS